MRKPIVFLLVLSTVYIVYAAVFGNQIPVAKAEEACSIDSSFSSTYGNSSLRYVDIRVASVGHSGDTSVEIARINADGEEHWLNISTKNDCLQDPDKSSDKYRNDICQEKLGPGSFQYVFAFDADFTLRTRNSCGAHQDKFVAIGSLPQPPTPTPLPAGVTQHIVQVCMQPFVIDTPNVGDQNSCTKPNTGKAIINGWNDFSLDCFNWKDATNKTYDHVLELKTKSPLTKNVPVQIYRRTSLKFLGRSETNCNAEMSPEAYAQNCADFCAADKNGAMICSANESTWYDPQSFKVLDLSTDEVQNKLSQSPDSVLVLPHVRSYTIGNDNTGVGDQHYFYALQILNQAPPTPTPTPDSNNTNQTNESALRLASFTPTPTPAAQTPLPGDSSGCIAIYWDPRGTVADTNYLEPLEEAIVTLKSKNALGSIVNFLLPKNPLFRNPVTTASGGAFNFAVPAGTYFLSTAKNGFTFPIDTSLLSSSADRLRSFDPAGEYIDTTKLYNNSNEPIVEREGTVEVRNMLMKPPEDYIGTKPTILTYNQLLDTNSQQIVYGVVSHPKAIIGAFINNGLVSQTEASLNGQFRLILNSSDIPANTQNISLRVEKIPISGSINASTQFSNMYSVQLLPSHIAGFAFSSNYSVTPGALVEVIVPELNNLVYVSTHADYNGFAKIPNANMPPFPYLIRVRSAQTFTTLSIQKPSEFLKLNEPYYETENANPYNESIGTGYASPQTITKIKELSKKNTALVQQGKLEPLNKTSGERTQPTQTPQQIKSTPRNTGRLVALLVVILLLPISAGFIIMKSRNRTTEL